MPSNEKLVEHANGGTQSEEDARRLRRPALRALVQDFSPTWFTWTMNAGGLAELIHQCPYRFNGIDVIASVFFVKALILYIIFSVIFLARFAWFGKAAYHEIVNNIAELTFVSCWCIAFMVLTSNVALQLSTAWWGGFPFTIVAYVMWWFVQTWNMGSLFWAFITLIRRHDASDRRLPTSIIIPAVSVSTIGITGAVVTAFSHGITPRLAIPVMILSFNWTGIGILLGLILYVYLFHALLAQGWPPPDQITSLFILVGPMGQSAAALQILGIAAIKRFGPYDAGNFITAESAKSLHAACVLVALLLNGLGVIWLLFAVWAMIEKAWEKTLRWTPSWQATIFPNVTLTTSFLIFSEEMDSPAYRVITAMMIIILVVVYLINCWYTALWIWQGKMLIVREDWRVKQEMEQQKEK